MPDKTTKKLFSAVLIIAALKLTLACLGCDGPIPADSDSDCPSVDLPRPGGEATPAPQPTPVSDEPGNGLAPAPIKCSVGEVEDWGPEGYVPQIAGSPEGYAVAYNSPDGTATIRFLKADGTPTSPVMTLPSSPTGGWPQVVHGHSGYVVSDNMSAFDDTLDNIFVMGQDGSVKLSLMEVYGMSNLQIAGGDAMDRLMYTYADSTPENPNTNSVKLATLSEAGSITGQKTLFNYAPDPGCGRNFHGFAAKGDAVALGTHAYCSDGNGYEYHLLQLMVHDGDALRATIDLSQRFGSASLWVQRIAAVDTGFAVLWTASGKDFPIGSFLTFVGTDGSFQGTVKVPVAIDMAWNGSEFGLVSYDEETQVLSFNRLTARGDLLQTLRIGAEAMYYEGYPKIAGSGRSFALVWATENAQAAAFTANIKFAPVTCQ